MDRRSWLWRRKSSEKSPGETESSGSISSHSERFSDDQVYAIHNSQSPEVTSKPASNGEETNDIVKGLTEKLSSALLSLSAKEDSVKQHAKVAEEAVAGWEKAENEVEYLKQQLEVLTQKNSSLDGALKECVRQLRQAREDQEQKIQEAIDKRSHGWESTNSELESQLIQVRAKLESATTEASASVDPDLRSKVGALEKENSSLKLQLFSQSKDLKMATIERDLSTQAAEASSKQHLEDIRKVGKLEAECRRLKAIVSKASTSSATDSKPFVGSSVETDKHEVMNAELNQAEYVKACRRNHAGPTVDTQVMEDFLEMERLAGLPDIESESCSVVITLKAELEAMIDRTAELEERLEDMEEEKARLKTSLTECQEQLETSESQLMEAELKFRQLQIQLALTDGSKQSAEEDSKASKMKAEAAESELRTIKAEVRNLSLKIGSLEVELKKERALSSENLAKCQKLEDEVEKKQAFSSEILAKCSKLEDEVLSMKCNAELQQEALVHHAAKSNGELKRKQEKELAVAAGKFAECQKTIASLGRQLKSLASLEDFFMDEKLPELTTKALK